MRILSCALFAFTLPAQVSAPPPRPQWLDDLQKVQQEMYQAEIGSLDGKVEQAWRAALQAPRHPQFAVAAQMTLGFYQSQGYDLKAEQVLRQALAVVPASDTEARWNLMGQLAGHFENTQQLVKALAIRKGMPKQPRTPVTYGQAPLDYGAVALANLYERMGEFEKAEAAWKQAALPPAAETSPQPSEPGRGVVTVGITSTLGSGAPNELANFYARRGRRAEAEQIYKAALADAARSSSPYAWNGTADSYIAFLTQQRRFDEALDLARQSIDRLDASDDPQAVHMLPYRRQQLSRLLTQAGRPEDALAVQKQAVEAAQARGPGTPEHVQALASLADTLINQNRLGEAEKVAAQMREAGASDSQNARFHESMAVQTLARIREMQNRPEEARRLRESVNVPDVMAPARRTSLYDVAGPAQQAAFQGNVADAVAAVDNAMALAAEGVRTNPQELSSLMGLAQGLMARKKEQEARRIAAETLALLEEAPDHPRVADALGSMASLLAGMGMTAEAEQAIERQKKILIGAKGADSPALNAIGYGRIALMQRQSDWAGVLDERKRMLGRTESTTGSKSREALYALREVAWAYPAMNDWAGEERILATLLDRTVNFSGESSLEHAHILVQMANRASQNREFDRALNWIDQAIEVARTLPDADMHLPFMTQNRAQIVKAKDVRTGAAPCTPASVSANPDGRWVDTDCFRRTDGARLGNAPPRAIIVGRPAVIRDRTPRTPVALPAEAAPPATAKP